MPNIVYVLDRNCSLLACNRNFLSLLSLNEKEEIIGTSPYPKLVHMAKWSKERTEKLKKDDIEVLLSAKPSYDVAEAPVVDPTETILYFLSTRVPLFNEANEVTGLVCILRDITDTKRMQDQLQKLKKQLQRYNSKDQSPESPEVSVLPIEQLIHKNPPKVLMVEDNSIAQKAAQALLMQLDCHVDVAESGDKATALFSPGKYDLIFMDIGLEDTSGYVVAKTIRQLEQGSIHHVPIIALTGYQADIVKYDCEDYSMEGALTKPLTTEQAKQIIQHYIYHIDVPVSGLKTVKGDN